MLFHRLMNFEYSIKEIIEPTYLELQRKCSAMEIHTTHNSHDQDLILYNHEVTAWMKQV